MGLWILNRFQIKGEVRIHTNKKQLSQSWDYWVILGFSLRFYFGKFVCLTCDRVPSVFHSLIIINNGIHTMDERAIIHPIPYPQAGYV
ncbi:hypothetical protein GDO86_019217 [Hymenochirus boettgeri]|uniref:Uncharacterized protein n=1 Tax=Hymenochirus boettgeri TaxID=247094 RepID=A0A8T2IHT3_9PIPI|nr:hypothetical protein GDO86_019217 [Hymenochirus boettgeri]